eukprot:TRINITY_DN15618_c0_g1_i2.p1 TRINITY_DN15618_c0_g1~~TRINITY_DN15618_c0_g1_i2.p1  ORF type:complete len:249 (-),score=43.51 TRINITY_DN15618_c0_g1_i2:25-771(-)
MQLLLSFSELFHNQKVRDEDVQQRDFENDVSRFVLEHHLIKEERRRVNIRAEQLKAIQNSAAVMAGFAATFLAQVSIPQDESVDTVVLSFFGTSTAIAIAANLMSLLLTSLILMAILNFDCVKSVKVEEVSFQDFWKSRCEQDWKRAYKIFLWGLIFFIFDIAFCAWVQFRVVWETGLIASIVSAILLLFIFLWVKPRWGSATNQTMNLINYREALNVPVAPQFNLKEQPEPIAFDETEVKYRDPELE